MKKTFLIMLAILLIMPLVSAYSGGSGTVGDPYQIATCLDLNQTRNNLTSYFKLTADVDCYDTRYWANGFSPIGFFFSLSNTTNTFTGDFNGNGKAILSLYIYNITPMTGATYNGAGLFGKTNNAKIYNLTMYNFNITGRNFVGAIAGQADASTLSDILLNGTINVANNCASEGIFTVGSVAGYFGYSSASFASRVASHTTINAPCSGGSSSHIGGLYGDYIGGSPATTNDSYYLGNLVLTGGSSVGFMFGGIATSSLNDKINRSFSIVTTNLTGSSFGGIQYSGGSSQDSFWNNQTSGIATSSTGTSRNTSAMLLQSTYTNYDFTNTWSINENVTYPRLRSFSYTSYDLHPVVSVSATTNNTNITTLPLSFNVTATDENLSNISIRVYNSSGSLYSTTTVTSSPASLSTISLPTGTIYVNATALDNESREARTLTYTYFVDLIAPDYSIDAPVPSNGGTFSPKNMTIEVSSTATDYSYTTVFLYNSTSYNMTPLLYASVNTTGTTVDSSSANDDDWSTYSYATAGSPSSTTYYYWNYSGALSSQTTWHVRNGKYGEVDDILDSNLTLSSSCLQQSTLQLRARSSRTNLPQYTSNWYCYNGTGWDTLLTTQSLIGTDARIYEQELLTVSYQENKSSSSNPAQLTFSNLTNETYYYAVVVYDTSGSSNTSNAYSFTISYTPPTLSSYSFSPNPNDGTSNVVFVPNISIGNATVLSNTTRWFYNGTLNSTYNNLLQFNTSAFNTPANITVEFKIIDEYQSYAAQNYSFSVADTIAPVISSVQFDASSYNVDTVANLSIQCVDAKNSVSYATITYEDPLTLQTTVNTTGSGNYSKLLAMSIIGTWRITNVVCVDTLGNIANQSFTNVTASVSAPGNGGSSSGGGGGGSSLNINDLKAECKITVSPTKAYLSNSKRTVELVIDNKDTQSYAPVFAFSENTIGSLTLTNSIVTVLPGQKGSFGVRSTATDLAQGSALLTLTSANCKDIIVEVSSAESASLGVIEELFSAGTTTTSLAKKSVFISNTELAKSFSWLSVGLTFALWFAVWFFIFFKPLSESASEGRYFTGMLWIAFAFVIAIIAEIATIALLQVF